MQQARSNSWVFYQLRLFFEYKGLRDGVEVVAVPPAYTSQTCHCCLHIGLRFDKKFKCGNCGLSCDADLNGAKMIATLEASVNSPGGSNCLYCVGVACASRILSTDSSGLLKAHTDLPIQCGWFTNHFQDAVT